MALTDHKFEWIYIDKSHRGHEVPNPLGVFISGQKRGALSAIKRELRRQSAIEAVIGHMKTDGHFDCNIL